MTKNIIFIFALSLLLSCGTTKKMSTEALQVAFDTEDYTTVFAYSSAQIKKMKKENLAVPESLLNFAGKSALALGKIEEAENYIQTSLYAVPQQEELYPLLADIYKNTDSSKEIELLEKYNRTFATGKYRSDFNDQLFTAYAREKNHGKVYATWVSLSPELKKNEANAMHYLKACNYLLKTDDANKAAKLLLGINSKNALAQETIAFNTYKVAEKEYKDAFKTYNDKKTTLAHGILRRDLKKISAKYRKSRDILETLYAETENKVYAKYLTNIYGRLQDKSKMNYWKQRSN